MKFISIIVAWGLVQLWGSAEPVQKDAWFRRWVEQLKPVFGPGTLRLAALVIGPMLALEIVIWIIDDWLFGLLLLALAVVVLLYSLGRDDLSLLLNDYLRDWASGDFEGAYQRAIAIGNFAHGDTINDIESLHQRVRRALFYAGFERWFAVIFWFFLLGPVGALGYRLVYFAGESEALDDEDRRLADQLRHYLDWLPARLMAASFALTGNFVQSVNCWARSVADNGPVDELLDHCGCSALSDSSDERAFPGEQERAIEAGREELFAVQNLISRTVICWLVVIALLQLIAF